VGSTKTLNRCHASGGQNVAQIQHYQIHVVQNQFKSLKTMQ
jgi:hypothetical protein